MVTLTTKSVLIIEDNSADAYLIQRAVEDCGIDLQFWVVPDGPEALTFLRKEPPLTHVPTADLIILDLQLPKMFGTEILSAIRKIPAYRAIPVVIFSSAPKEREEAACLELGANEYIQKSVNYYDYFDSIKRIVQHWLRPASA
jgi:chemotaxis family two-component system response regulator Rcp1